MRSIAYLDSNSYTTPNFKVYDCNAYVLYSSLSLLWNTVLTFQFHKNTTMKMLSPYFLIGHQTIYLNVYEPNKLETAVPDIK